jgi:hypothetical protein
VGSGAGHSLFQQDEGENSSIRHAFLFWYRHQNRWPGRFTAPLLLPLSTPMNRRPGNRGTFLPDIRADAGVSRCRLPLSPWATGCRPFRPGCRSRLPNGPRPAYPPGGFGRIGVWRPNPVSECLHIPCSIVSDPPQETKSRARLVRLPARPNGP